MNLVAVLRRLSYHARGIWYRGVIIASGGRCGRNLLVESGLTLRHGAHSGLAIGDNVYFGVGTVIDCPSSGRLVIGDRVTLTHGVLIGAIASVTIGNDALIGEYVSIRDAEHGMDTAAGPMRDQPMHAKGCEIGSDVWIGRGCAILGGATLEHGCIVGANSVVKGVVPAQMIAAGAPARVIRARTGEAPLRQVL